jgi:hypothetical protein
VRQSAPSVSQMSPPARAPSILLSLQKSYFASEAGCRKLIKGKHHDEFVVMRWVRAKLRTGARLALLALAVQIALSFGHVHLGNVQHASAIASTGGQPSGSTPTQHPVGDADDYCAICATIHLSATSLLPQPPQLPAPFAVRQVEHSNCIAVSFFSTRRAPFQSRAPPLA